MASKLLSHLHKSALRKAIAINQHLLHRDQQNHQTAFKSSSLLVNSRFLSSDVILPLPSNPVVVDPSAIHQQHSTPPPSSSSSSSSSPLRRDAKKVSSSSSSLNELELAKFAAIAETWWDSEGPFKPLHALNPARLAFIRSTLCRHFGKDPLCPRPFEGLRIADVGCGGGILSEPLARMGAIITGIDAVEKNVKIASVHAESDSATSSIEYLCTTAEKLVEEGRTFDAVMSLEVIEHVAEPAEFCKSLSALTVPGGATVISTINRSMRAYATAIVAAEYILHWLPKGTHQWSSFLTPEELVLILQRVSINIEEMAGFVYNPLSRRWAVSDDIGVNFIAYGTKTSMPQSSTQSSPTVDILQP